MDRLQLERNRDAMPGLIREAAEKKCAEIQAKADDRMAKLRQAAQEKIERYRCQWAEEDLP